MVTIKRVPTLLKFIYFIFVAIFVPVYWFNYGPQNFLWISDIGVFLTLVALWLESPLLISIALVAVFPLEMAWIIDFFLHLCCDNNVIGIAHYMFDPSLAVSLRGISLFHIFNPVLWIWYLIFWGYDKRALIYALALTWALLILTYLLTDPIHNINWVFTPIKHYWAWITPLGWLFFQLMIFTFFSCLPMHYLCIILSEHFQ